MSAPRLFQAIVVARAIAGPAASRHANSIFAVVFGWAASRSRRTFAAVSLMGCIGGERETDGSTVSSRAMRLVLASQSPRRRDLLDAAGIACDVRAVDVDERRHAGETPDVFAERLAREKASAGARLFPDRTVLGADTIVVVDDEVLGKPRDAADAVRMLALLSGRSHEVLTGVAIAHAGRVHSAVDRTRVWFSVLSDTEIEAYVASGEPLDKAGAYAIQGLASRFIPRIDGSYANVVGLPVTTVVELLKVLGAARL